jgi:tripartite-type tricarboxylate transporter receptor subunit TctC
MAQKKINVPVVIGDKRIADFPQSPAAMEFLKDAHTRQELELMMVSQTYNRPLMAPPGTPPERVAELRKGLADTIADPGFLADLDKRNLTIDFVPGQEMTAAFARAYAYPPAVVGAVRDMMATN